MLAVTSILWTAIWLQDGAPAPSAPPPSSAETTKAQDDAKPGADAKPAAAAKPADPSAEPAKKTPASKSHHSTKPKSKSKGAAKPADGAKAAAPKSAPRKTLEIPTPRPKAPEVPSYKVALRMKNGRRFLGLVSRDKAFHELVFAGAHHGEAVYKRHDRFMLRFVDGLDGDLELAWDQVSKLEVRDVLDSAGVRAMEDAYAGMRLARAVQAERLPDPEAAPAVDGEAPAADPANPAEPKPDGGEQEISLLTEFAPAAGWTPERKKQIEWRRTVVGTFPDAREQRFLDHYDEWLPLYVTWEREEFEKQRDEESPKSKPEARVPSKSPVQEPAKESDERGERKPDAKPEAKPDAPVGEKPAAPPAGDGAKQDGEKPEAGGGS